MANGKNKYQSREDKARVRDLLMQEWDPIAVAGIPEAADEYDNYVGELYVMLMDRRASVEQITDYLISIAVCHMGFSAHPALLERCVARLLILLQ